MNLGYYSKAKSPLQGLFEIFICAFLAMSANTRDQSQNEGNQQPLKPGRVPATRLPDAGIMFMMSKCPLSRQCLPLPRPPMAALGLVKSMSRASATASRMPLEEKVAPLTMDTSIP